MTVDQFKKDNPHLAHLEGDALWNAMEHLAVLNAKAMMPEPKYLEQLKMPTKGLVSFDKEC